MKKLTILLSVVISLSVSPAFANPPGANQCEKLQAKLQKTEAQRTRNIEKSTASYNKLEDKQNRVIEKATQKDQSYANRITEIENELNGLQCSPQN